VSITFGRSGQRQAQLVGSKQFCVECKQQQDPWFFADRQALRCKACVDHEAEKRARVPVRRDRLTEREALIHVRCLAYGIRISDYTRLLAEQGGLCAICRRKPRSDRPLFIDHDHKSGRVRGLLCGRCNTGIGYFHDDPDKLERAVDYLEEPPANRAGVVGFGKRDVP
jgi:hypothetical protein